MTTAVQFSVDGDVLTLIYKPRDDVEWVLERFRVDQELVIKRTFYFRKIDLFTTELQSEDMASDDDACLIFRFGLLRDGYYLISPEKLGLDIPVSIHRDCNVDWKWFTAGRTTSVFGEIAKLRPGAIVIGGNATNAIPETEFVRLLAQFPTSYELSRYSQARVAAVVREYMDTEVDAIELHQQYVNRRLSPKATPTPDVLLEMEVIKLRYVHDKLTSMLASEDGYSEKLWQSEILKIVCLLNPRYIKAISSVAIRDADAKVNRQLDILLIDASGNVDIIEIKKPFQQSIITSATYRNNHIPMRELSGSIMQIEKYIYYLNRWGKVGEDALTKKYQRELPDGFRINITNPKGIVIIGRDNNLSSPQKLDLEVVKRQYKSIVDIVTYDDLIRRLNFMLQQLEATLSL